MAADSFPCKAGSKEFRSPQRSFHAATAAIAYFVHSRIWNRLKIGKGDFVEVLLTRGEPPKEPPIPEDLASALQMTKGAAEAFRQVTSALRREFINWIENAKQPETRAASNSRKVCQC